MKLSRKKLKNLILKEMQKLIDEDALVHKNNPGMLSKHNDSGRQMRHVKGKRCYECGAKMYEDDASIGTRAGIFILNRLLLLLKLFWQFEACENR